MDAFARFIIRFRRPILIFFIILALISIVLLPMGQVNYNLADYLPADAQSTKALEIMKEEFSAGIPNTDVLIHDVSLTQALTYKEELKKITGVEDVIWLDDLSDIRQPLETMDSDLVEGYYKNNHALYTVTVREGMELETINNIRQLIGPNNGATGPASDTADMQQTTSAEVNNALTIALPAIIIILLLSTVSWIEPLLFLTSIGIAILINMGSNVFFGEVSFITNSVSPILQLAVSVDYAIFLMHSFSAHRKTSTNVEEAMEGAIRTSLSTIAASATTTLFGFIALTFMQFGIGMDLGFNLAKGIIISFLSCTIFLPTLILSTYKIIDKTSHRPFLPNFQNLNRFFSKLIIPTILLVAIIIVPSYLGQMQTEFIYGNGNMDTNTVNGRNRMMLIDEFGQITSMVLLVPKGDIPREMALSEEISQHKEVSSVLSYVNAVGGTIPREILEPDIIDQFYSSNYSRIIAQVNTADEGELAFQTVGEIKEIARKYYGDRVYSVGESTNLYDMKNVVEKDNLIVNLIAITAIFIILAITFRSAILPFILLLTIETGIWVNLAIPYFTDTPINFLGYLVVNTVQLGATIDYAILLTTTYMQNRTSKPQKEAMNLSVATAFPSILVSAATLAIAGFTLHATSSNMAVADLGLLLGRGALFSLTMVFCFLPAMLKVLDKVISKTTYKANFYSPSK